MTDLKTPSPEAHLHVATPALAGIGLAGVAEQLEQAGAWRACSGCHELIEGHPTGWWSKTLKSYMGGGCRECGGIGAIWDNTDYSQVNDLSPMTSSKEADLPVLTEASLPTTSRLSQLEARTSCAASANYASAPPQLNVPCPCTLIEQDEDCPIGYPSMICGVCKGIGNTTPEQVTALACEMIKIASDNGEPEDPFAAWESIDLIKSQHAQFRKALDKISGMIDDESAGFDDAIETATYALRLAKADDTTGGSDNG